MITTGCARAALALAFAALAAAPSAALTIEVEGIFGSTPVPSLTGRAFTFRAQVDPADAPSSSSLAPSTGSTTTVFPIDAADAFLAIDGDDAILGSADIFVLNATRAPNRDQVGFRFYLPGRDTGPLTANPARDGFDFSPDIEFVEYTSFIFTVGLPLGYLDADPDVPQAETLAAGVEFVSFSITYCFNSPRNSSCSAGSGNAESAAFRAVEEGTGGVSAVPAPAAGGLLAAAFGALALARRRRAA